MRKLIRRERRVEMNCEGGLRWFDLRRWKEAENVLNGNFYGMNMLAERGIEMSFINVCVIKLVSSKVIGGRYLRMR